MALTHIIHCVCAVAAFGAPFHISNVFGDNAVLQRNQPVRVFGFGTSGATVNTTFGGKSYSAVVDSTTLWVITLDSTPAGGPFQLTFESSTRESAALNNILFGDVYLCGG
jgi:sialate O-acetylesterase